MPGRQARLDLRGLPARRERRGRLGRSVDRPEQQEQRDRRERDPQGRRERREYRASLAIKDQLVRLAQLDWERQEQRDLLVALVRLVQPVRR